MSLLNPSHRTHLALLLASALGAALGPAQATKAQQSSIAVGPKLRIVGVHGKRPPKSAEMTTLNGQPTLTAATPYPRPPLTGFLPLVAVTTSDDHKSGDLEWEHVLRTTYFGNPLNPPIAQNYVLAVADSGSVSDAFSYQDSFVVGMTGSQLTGNTVTVSGVSGDEEADVTYQLGTFVAPVSAIGPTGLLDTTQLIGHTNSSSIVLPDGGMCGNEPVLLPSFIGNEFLAFYNTLINVDQPQAVTLLGEPFVCPRTLIQSKSIALPVYPVKISMNIGAGDSISTASYLGDIFSSNPDFRTPIFPTVLSGAAPTIPVGGAFFASMGLLEGTPGPTNPVQTASVMVDTGAQSSVITPGMAANLNLPNEPDFMAEALGIGGCTLVPGYYIDYVQINGQGGPLQFSQVPVLVIDIQAFPDGQQHDGIMGMNLFWNRNVIFQPQVSGSGFLHVANPTSFAFGDFNHDYHVDSLDAAFFVSCTSGPGVLQTNPDCVQADADLDGDVDSDDFGAFQRCYSGSTALANTNCH